MLPCSAVQKLDRYGQFGQKRKSVAQFVTASLKDADGAANVHALTHVASWDEATTAIRRNPHHLSSSVLHALACGVGFIRAAVVSDDPDAALNPAEPAPKNAGDAPSRTNEPPMPAKDKATALVSEWSTMLSGISVSALGATAQMTESAAAAVQEAAGLLADVHPESELVVSRAADAGLAERCVSLVLGAMRVFRSLWSRNPAPKLINGGGKQGNPLTNLLCTVARLNITLERAVALTLAPAVNTSAARYYVFYRGDLDRLGPRMQVKDPSQYSLVGHTTNGHEQLSGAKSKIADMSTPRLSDTDAERFSSNWGAWIRRHAVVFRAFCADGSWAELANEQKRLAIQKDLDRSKGKKTKREKELERRERQAKRSGTSLAGTGSSVSGSSVSGGTSKTDDDDAASNGSAGTNLSAGNLSAASFAGRLSDVGSVAAMSFVSDVMSHFSHRSAYSAVSAASVASTMTMLPLAEPEEEEHLAHHSLDNNTNLPLILLEMMCQSLMDMIANLPEVLGYSSEHVTSLTRQGWNEVGRLFSVVNDFVRHPMQAGQQQKGQNMLAARQSLAESENRVGAGDGTSMSAFGINGEDNKGAASDDLAAAGIFSLPDDLRFNKALGYQCLGLILAKVILPALHGVSRAAGVIPGEASPNGEEEQEALFPTDTLVRESVTPTAFAETLAVCLGVYEAVASQIINANLKEILVVVSAGLTRELEATDAKNQLIGGGSPTSGVLGFFEHLIRRHGETNQLNLLLDAIVEICNSSDGVASRFEVILSLPPVAAAIQDAAGTSMDVETLIDFVFSTIEKVLPTEDGVLPANESADQLLRRATVLLRLCEVVIRGMEPTHLASMAVVERAAELDMTIATFLSLASDVEEADENEDDEEFLGKYPPLRESLPKQLRVLRTSLHVRSLTLLHAIRTLTARCLQDMGLDNTDSFIEAFEESLWNVTSSVETLAGVLTIETAPVLLPEWGFSKRERKSADFDPCAVLRALTVQRLELARSVCYLLDKPISCLDEAKTMARFALEGSAAAFVADVHQSSGSSSDAQHGYVTLNALELLAEFAPKAAKKFLTGVEQSRLEGDSLDSNHQLRWAPPMLQQAWLRLLVAAGDSLPNVGWLLDRFHGTLLDAGGVACASELTEVLTGMVRDGSGDGAMLDMDPEVQRRSMALLTDLLLVTPVMADQWRMVLGDEDASEESVPPAVDGSLLSAAISQARFSFGQAPAVTAAASKLIGAALHAAHRYAPNRAARDAVTATAVGILADCSTSIRNASTGDVAELIPSLTTVEACVTGRACRVLQAYSQADKSEKNKKRKRKSKEEEEGSDVEEVQPQVDDAEKVTNLSSLRFTAESSAVLGRITRRSLKLLMQTLKQGGDAVSDVAQASMSVLVVLLQLNIGAAADIVATTQSYLEELRSPTLGEAPDGRALIWALASLCSDVGQPDIEHALIASILSWPRERLTTSHILTILKLFQPGSEERPWRLAATQYCLRILKDSLRSESTESICEACDTLKRVSGVANIRLRPFKAAFGWALECAACRTAGLQTLAAALAVARTPSPVLHKDASFVEQLFLVLLRAFALPLPTDSAQFPLYREVLNTGIGIITMLCVKFPSQLRSRQHLLPPLVAPLYQSLLLGLRDGVLDATDANAIASLFYHLTRPNITSLPGGIPSPAFQASTLASALFGVGAATSIDTFARYSTELDDTTRDVLRVTLGGKAAGNTLPSKQKRLETGKKRTKGDGDDSDAEAPEEDKATPTGWGASHFAGLTFAALPSQAAKSLYKTAVMRAAEEESDVMTMSKHVAFGGSGE